MAESSSAIAACAGMGCDRVSRAVAAVLQHGRVERLLSVGLAGGCGAQVRAGESLRFGTVVDVRSGERFVCEEGEGLLATTPRIAGVDEKRRLYKSYGATGVDMEAACVGRLAKAHGLAFGAVKGISDDAGFSLDGFDRFATADGRFREVAFALHTAIRPWQWRSTVQLGRNSSAALRAMTATVLADIRMQ